MSSSKKDKSKRSSEKKHSCKDDYAVEEKKKCHEECEHEESSNEECEREHEKKHYDDDHHSADVVQEADQFAGIEQGSEELIFIKDSCNINVQTTDTQAAVSLQVGLQLAIAVIVRITIGDTATGENISQQLLQAFDSEQKNKQKIIIDNSKDITITTTDTDLAINIQALLQVLVSLVIKIDVL